MTELGASRVLPPAAPQLHVRRHNPPPERLICVSRHPHARHPDANARMDPVIDHIQITVRDLPVAAEFYDRLMPLLGFSLEKRTSARISAHDFEVVEYTHPRLAFAITSPRQRFRNDDVHRRRPGSLHHLAFRVQSREEVDELHRKLKAIGAVIVAPPREYPEYRPAGYYALFFKDLEGIKYEVVTHSQCH